ncbi:MAG TPA: hypothetical protein VF671_13310 [Pseudomonas sp.]|jgi:hypothetical protein|uniref:hypothetical protein n=1 Tax=Pseudomonas sp. TaxID=306 RepID=UPI002EDAF230
MTSYEGHTVQDHQDFLFDELLPNIVNYANSNQTPPEVVVMAAFLSLATILQSKGLGRDTLMKAIDAARLNTHDAPGGLH